MILLHILSTLLSQKRIVYHNSAVPANLYVCPSICHKSSYLYLEIPKTNYFKWSIQHLHKKYNNCLCHKHPILTMILLKQNKVLYPSFELYIKWNKISKTVEMSILCINVPQQQLASKHLIVSPHVGKEYFREMERLLAQSTQRESIQLTTGCCWLSAGLKLQTH